MPLQRKYVGIMLALMATIEVCFVVLFGALFPVMGVVFLFMPAAPQGDDPVAIGITLIVAGLFTACIYAAPAAAAGAGAYGLLRHKRWARTVGLVGAILNVWVLPPLGMALGALSFISLVMDPDPPAQT